MERKHAGVHRKLRDLIRHETKDDVRREDFLLTVCAAHKLNLVVLDQTGLAFNLTNALVKELHNLLGSTVATRARVIYAETAEDMGFPVLQMDALHAVRWAARLQNSVSKILRECTRCSLKPWKDWAKTAKTKSRAKGAAFALKDGHTFIILHHVNATLSYFARLSEALQNEEALMVDYLSHWRQFDFLLSQETLKNQVYDYLADSGLLASYDTQNGQYHGVNSAFLKTYYTLPDDRALSQKKLLAYAPYYFADYNRLAVQHIPAERREETASLRGKQKFRPLETVQSLASQLSEAARQIKDCVNALYEDVRKSFRHYMEPEKRPTEATASFPYALDRHIILDIIECNGDYESFKNCILPDTSAATRGYPVYIDDEGNVDKTKRHELVLQSINAIEKFCSLPGSKKHFMEFYNTIATSVTRMTTWPTNLRKDRTSIRFYQTLLNNAKDLEIPPIVRKAIKCILVIPASNADPERSFSQANRLTRGERGNLGNKTLNDLMAIQRDGPSVLTIRPRTLVDQWIKPRPVLGLKQHMPSTFDRSDSFMKQGIMSDEDEDVVGGCITPSFNKLNIKYPEPGDRFEKSVLRFLKSTVDARMKIQALWIKKLIARLQRDFDKLLKFWEDIEDTHMHLNKIYERLGLQTIPPLPSNQKLHLIADYLRSESFFDR
ncbi:hypothetical protein OSTOST_04490 [Ostertagia ostertagi]